MIGVVKAYSHARRRRAVSRPSKTTTLGQHIRDRGNEYGTVTRRPRRCGWFDAVAVRYTARLSGVDTLAVMLLDVLSELPEIKICTAYEIDGRRIDACSPATSTTCAARAGLRDAARLAGGDHRRAARWTDLPANARAYLGRLSELIGRPVEVVSVGPDREQTIVVNKL